MSWGEVIYRGVVLIMLWLIYLQLGWLGEPAHPRGLCGFGLIIMIIGGRALMSWRNSLKKETK